jgi:hypothetical protein
MTKVVLDDSRVVAVLERTQQRAEICDPSGRVLGVYVPSSSGTIAYRGAKSPYSRAELERIYKEEADKARPLAGFWDEMRKKHPEEFK